jgi:hypothetical protein
MKDFVKGLSAFIILVGLFGFIIFIFLRGLAIIEETPKNVRVQRIIFSGKIVNSQTGEWLNNRLVLVFLHGKEVGRSISALGEFLQSGQGIHDGLFVADIENAYGLTINILNNSGNKDVNFSLAYRPKPGRILGLGEEILAYLWLNEMEEGSSYHIPVPSKNVQYILKVIKGDISTLPLELQVPDSTILRDDGTLIVALKDSPASAAPISSDIMVNNVNYAASSETVDLNKITVPINNCGGSSKISQKYIQTQTFVREYRAEAGVGIGLQIPLTVWLRLVPELQVKYGFQQGQIDTKTVEYDMAAEPGTNLVYLITWQEIWEKGMAQVTSGIDNVLVPFKVKSNVVYKIDSQSLGCN